jgi:hypothetical protein
MIERQDWTITFDNGSTATYYNTTATRAVNYAVRDWYPAKRVVAWAPATVDVFSIPLD